MKKTIIALLALLLALAFTACTGKTAATTTAAKEGDAEGTTTAAQQEEAETYYYGELNYGGKTEDELDDYYTEIYGDAYQWNNGTTAGQWKAVLYDDLTSGILGLERGDVNALFLLEPVAKYIVACNEEILETYDTGDPAVTALAMATLDTNTELLEKLNKAMAELEAEGKLEELVNAYLTDLTRPMKVTEMPVIEGAETIRVVVTGDLPPFDYVNAKGQAAGYNIALLSAISKKLGMNIELVYANAGSRFIQLTSGKADVIFWARGASFSESAEFDFSADVPEGIAVTTPYTTQKSLALVFKHEGVITLDIGEGFPKVECLDTLVKQELTQEQTDAGMLYSFKDPEELVHFQVSVVDNAEGKTLDEHVQGINAVTPGCIETKNWDGKEGRLITYFNEDNAFVKHYVFASGDKLAIAEYIYPTTEIKLGTTNLYTWLPKAYVERPATEYEIEGDVFATYFALDNYHLADVSILEWKDTEWTYDMILDSWGESNAPMTEEEFNALAQDGFSMEDLQSFYAKAYQPVESLILEANGITFMANDIRYQFDVEWTEVLITAKEDDDTFVEFCLWASTEEWPAMGEALAYATHMGSQAK